MSHGYGQPRWSSGSQQQGGWGGGRGSGGKQGGGYGQNQYGRQSWGEGGGSPQPSWGGKGGKGGQYQSWGEGGGRQSYEGGRPSWGQNRPSYEGGRASYDGHKGEGGWGKGGGGGRGGKQHHHHGQQWVQHGKGQQGKGKGDHHGQDRHKGGKGKSSHDRVMLRWGEQMAVCDILDRLPGVPVHPDVMRVVPLWAENAFAHLPTFPTCHTKVIFPQAPDSAVDAVPAPETPAPLAVYVVLGSVDQPRQKVNNHYGTRVKLLYLRDPKGNLSFYGGAWKPEDGADISAPATWYATAKRQLTEQGLTIPEGTTFSPFLEFQYDREGTQKVVAVVAKWPTEVELPPLEEEEKKADEEKTEEEKADGEAKPDEPKPAPEIRKLQLVTKTIMKPAEEGKDQQKLFTPVVDHLAKAISENRLAREDMFEYNLIAQQLHESMQTYAGICMFSALQRTKRKANVENDRVAKKKKLSDDFEADKQQALDKEKAVWNEETCDSTDDAREAYLEEKTAAFEKEWAEKKLEVTKLIEEVKPTEEEKLATDNTLAYIIGYLERPNAPTQQHNLHFMVIKTICRCLRKELSTKQEQDLINLIKATDGPGLSIKPLIEVPEDQLMEQDVMIIPKPKEKKAAPKEKKQKAEAKEEAKEEEAAKEGETEAKGEEDAEMKDEATEDKKEETKEEETKEEEAKAADAKEEDAKEEDAKEEEAKEEEAKEEEAKEEEMKEEQAEPKEEKEEKEEAKEEPAAEAEAEPEAGEAAPEAEEEAEDEEGEAAEGEVDEEAINKMAYKDLRALCKERGLAAVGKAEVLRARLLGKE